MKLELKDLGRWLVLGIPFVWLLVFLIIPFLVILSISFSHNMIAIPPYSSVLTYHDGVLSVFINLKNYLAIMHNSLYLAAYVNSFKVALFTTLFCLLLGYPMAYAIAYSPKPMHVPLLLMVLAPCWTSFLIRIYAWFSLLGRHGAINQCLVALHIVNTPIHLLNTSLAIYLGTTYSYLPFMIFPLYLVLSRIPKSLIEVAMDLGAAPWQTFVHIILPLSLPGIRTGSMLVFIPIIGEYIIPELLGGAKNIMIGKLLWEKFFTYHDWPTAAALSISLIVLLVIVIRIAGSFSLLASYSTSSTHGQSNHE